MEVDEKLRIIRRWTHQFLIGERYDGILMGSICFTRSIHQTHTPWHVYHDPMVEDAYHMVFDHVYKIVDVIENDQR